MNKFFSYSAIAIFVLACSHAADSRAKDEFATNATNRIQTMEGNIKHLEARKEKMFGTPRDDMQAAVEYLRSQTEEAKTELKAVEQSADATTTANKRADLDRELHEMDSAYNGALEMITAH